MWELEEGSEHTINYKEIGKTYFIPSRHFSLQLGGDNNNNLKHILSTNRI